MTADPRPGVARRHRPSVRGQLTVLVVFMLALAAVVTGTELLLPPGAPVASAPAPTPDVRCPSARQRLPSPVSSAVLLNCTTLLDGRRVTFRGEVVGALLRRRTGAWAQLNDDAYGLGAGPLPTHRQVLGTNSGLAVLLSPDAARAVRWVGGPRTRGDVLEVLGTFRRAAAEDGGGTAIIADRARVVHSGGPFEPVPASRQRVAAIVLAVATTLYGGWFVITRRR